MKTLYESIIGVKILDFVLNQVNDILPKKYKAEIKKGHLNKTPQKDEYYVVISDDKNNYVGSIQYARHDSSRGDVILFNSPGSGETRVSCKTEKDIKEEVSWFILTWLHLK